MEFPVVEAVETVFTIVQKIHSAVENVRSFKKRAIRLEKRVDNILLPTKALYEQSKDKLESTNDTYKKALNDLSACLHDINIFLLELGNKSRVSLFVKSEDIRQQFDEFTSRLNDLSGDITLCMTVTHYIKSSSSATFEASKRTYDKTGDEVQDLKEMLTYVGQLEKRIDLTDPGMSQLNKVYLQDFFNFIKVKNERLQRLVDAFDSDDDDDDEDTF